MDRKLSQRRSAMSRPLQAFATLLLVGGLLSALYYSQIEAIVAEGSRAEAAARSGGLHDAVSVGGGGATASRPDPSGVVGSATIRRGIGTNATSSHATMTPMVTSASTKTKRMVPLVTSTKMNYEKEAKLKASRLEKLYSTKPPGLESPACRPHFQSVDDSASWEFSDSRFQRMAFHHARKAGGTSIADYLVRVARNYGIEFVQTEFDSAEEPGTADVPTFYVTHLREPVSRSISHFRYQGRWSCRDLINWTPRSSMASISISNTDDGEPDDAHDDDDDGTRRMLAAQGDEFAPTLENANPFESWNKTGGLVENDCPKRAFRLGECAIQCYTQWYSGMSCPQWQIPMDVQYKSASTVLFRYNMIIVLEWLSIPEYAEAVERFFGVPGVTKRRGAYCERSSRRADKLFPLVPKNESVERLRDLNELDVKLYGEITNCDGEGYPFPSLDESRFANTTRRVPYERFMDWRSAKKRAKTAKSPAEGDAIMNEFWRAADSGEGIEKTDNTSAGKLKLTTWHPGDKIEYVRTNTRMTAGESKLTTTGESKLTRKKPNGVGKDKRVHSRTNSKEVSKPAGKDHPKFAKEDHVSQVVHLGSEHGGWSFDEKLAGPRPVVYSFGLGVDISWDLAMIEKYNVTLFGFDPTPKSEAYVLARMDEDPIVGEKFLYVKEGLANRTGTAVFTNPADPDHVSMRIGPNGGQGETIEAPVSTLDDLMAKLHHRHIDILKMSVEGAEYDVLEDLVARDRLPFTQLLVEWHWRSPGPGPPGPVPPTPRHRSLLGKLWSKGFEVVESRDDDRKTTMIRKWRKTSRLTAKLTT